MTTAATGSKGKELKKETKSRQVEPTMSLEDGIASTYRAMSLCLSNKFGEAQALLQPHVNNCMYHALGFSTISYLQAIMTYEADSIDAACKSVKRSLEVCNRFRRNQTWTETLYHLVGKPHFNGYSEVEIHAELCYAECLLERAVLTFIQDENLISFIKGGLKIKHAYSLYRSCLQIMKDAPATFEASRNRFDFEGGVHLGIGTFNLLLSLLPAKILRLLEWVGFSGDKNLGLNHLDEGVKMDGIRSPLCAITVLGYRIVVGPILGFPDSDETYTRSVLKSCLESFPEGAIFHYFAGRMEQVQGKFEKAIKKYESAVSVSVDWKQVHHVCYWELMWCNSFKGNWTEAARHANILSKESKWSKTAYLYLEGCFKLMEMFEKSKSGKWSDDETEEKILDIFRLVPEYKQKVAGKSLPFEKYAVYKANKYVKNNHRLVLSGLEVIYIWNGFSMVGHRKELIQNFLDIVKITLKEVEADKDSNEFYVDEYCLCKLLQGMCLRYLQSPIDAEKCLQEVVQRAHEIKIDNYLPPYAFAEIGFLYRSLGRNSDAINQLEHLKKKFVKYSLESRLHFRVHSNIQALHEESSHTNANHLVNEQTFSSDEDTFFDVSEAPASPSHSLSSPADQFHSPSGSGHGEPFSVRKETAI